MLIYCDKPGPRLEYTLHFVFSLRGLSYRLTSDLEDFTEAAMPKWNYSERELAEIPQIRPAGLLFETHIAQPEIAIAHFQQEPIVSLNGTCDPLAAIFYVLSRMEEYTPGNLDEHGRFPAESSVLKQHDLLHTPVCDRWAEALISWLREQTGPIPEITREIPKIIPSFDIDNAFAYLHKSRKRRMLSNAKDILQRNTKRLRERSEVLRGRQKDPYDTFDVLKEVASKYDTRLFWLLADFGKYDKNLSHNSTQLRKLIRELGELTITGIHPGYGSAKSLALLETEKRRLERILERPVTLSRQHFLRLSFPETFHRLLACGIKADYSMGFAQDFGFRLGTARTVQWFDLDRNEVTELELHPFVYMDGTLNEYLELSPGESKQVIRDLYTQVKRYGGDFCFIWHNETIGDYGKWKHWKEVFEFTLTLNEHA